MAVLVARLAEMRDSIARRTDPIVAALLALAVVMIAGVLVTYAFGLLAKSALVVHIDNSIGNYIDGHRASTVSGIMRSATLVGSYPVDYTIAAVGGLIIGVLSRRWVPLLAMIAAILTEKIMQSVMTKLIHGAHPAQALAIGTPGGYFSGGSARTLIVCGLLAYFLGWLTITRLQRVLFWTFAALAAFTEGYSRLYLGRHFAIDIVAGWLAGAFILSGYIFAAEALRPAGPPSADRVRPGHGSEDAIPRARVGKRAARLGSHATGRVRA
jgi:membrane-associated phospholipid phosphatase